MKKRSILFCINYMHTGGVEKSLLALADALPRDAFDVHIALMQHKGELLDDIPPHVTVHTLHSLERNTARLAHPLRHASDISGPLHYLAAKTRGSLHAYYSHIVGKERDIRMHFDIAVSYQGPAQLLDWYVATHIDADIKVAWIHFDITRCYINRRSQRAVYPAYDRIFTVSESARDLFCSVFPEFAPRCDVFHNLVDAAAVRRLGNAYTVDRVPQATMLCTVGRMTMQKAPDVAIDVAVELKRRGFRFCWNWVGADELLEPCRAEAEKREVADSLHFVGLKANPYPYMACADVYVQPSRFEGYCITLAEARAFGLPVVCTDFAGSEQVEGLPNARILHAPSVSELADAIIAAAAMERIEAPESVCGNEIHKLLEL